MTPTTVLPPTLRGDLAEDWQRVLADAVPLVRLELESDPIAYAAFALGWNACAKRFIRAGKEKEV